MAGKKVGILALQGAFIEHENMIKKCGAEAYQVRKPEDLEKVEALIIPGGESTTIAKLIKDYKLDEKIKEKNEAGLPIWGTCAGMIILAKDVKGMEQDILGLMDISVSRNGFGRQVDSFETELEIKGMEKQTGVFIRAPYADKIWGEARVLSRYENKIVMVQQGEKLLATAFHPELTESVQIHQYFLNMI